MSNNKNNQIITNPKKSQNSIENSNQNDNAD